MRWQSGAFMKAIVPHVAQWKTLAGDNVPSEVFDRIESEGSSLQILRLKSSRTAQIGPRLGNGAQLQHLELMAIDTTRTSTNLQGLKHLQLSKLAGYVAPPFPDIFHILAHCSQLEVLSLDDVAFTETTIPPPAFLFDPDSLPDFLSLWGLQLTGIPVAPTITFSVGFVSPTAGTSLSSHFPRRP
ncbi:hypothetical protein FRB95_011730 [Tulasnella sp. JGI-2019a]|nr:hypothetical protein FRB95_011730 [Tulasnella sp. JGI-2019a]